MPGANCGGCGQPGCSGAAAAIAQGIMPANGCVAGGAAVAVEIARIMGVEIKETEPQVARVGCRYPVARADLKYDYLSETGVTDCRAAVLLYGGPKECPVGCIGLGSCVKACPFDALSIGPEGLPVVDETRCTGCGSCARTCPVGIMNLTSVTNRILGEYSLGDCTAPCQRTCPAGINIPEQIRQTTLGNYDEALKVIKERNPLPLICGGSVPIPVSWPVAGTFPTNPWPSTRLNDLWPIWREQAAKGNSRSRRLPPARKPLLSAAAWRACQPRTFWPDSVMAPRSSRAKSRWEACSERLFRRTGCLARSWTGRSRASWISAWRLKPGSPLAAISAWPTFSTRDTTPF